MTRPSAHFDPVTRKRVLVDPNGTLPGRVVRGS